MPLRSLKLGANAERLDNSVFVLLAHLIAFKIDAT